LYITQIILRTKKVLIQSTVSTIQITVFFFARTNRIPCRFSLSGKRLTSGQELLKDGARGWYRKKIQRQFTKRR